MGGWIIPPKITLAGKVIPKVKPRKGLNKINYDKFKVITTHALFIKDHAEATELLDMTIEPEKLKPYDIFLAGNTFFKDFYYPSVFVQEKHKSEIDDKGADLNYYRTYNYGLTKPKQTKKQTKGGTKRYKQIFITCDKQCSKYKKLTKRRFKCFNDCEKRFKKTLIKRKSKHR